MGTPSINLSEDLHHLAKNSDKSISQLARGGIERGVIEELKGVCWYCGSGIIGGEHRWTGNEPRISHAVQACERCLPEYMSKNSYLERAYDGENSYDVDISELPPTDIAYAAESAGVFWTDIYHAGEIDGITDASYWAAKSRHEGIIQDDRIPLIEIALRSHVLSLSKGERTLPVFNQILELAVTCSIIHLEGSIAGPPAFAYEITNPNQVGGVLHDQDEEEVREILQYFLDRIGPYEEESGRYCPACSVARNEDDKMCNVCFHRWEGCPENSCKGEVVYFINPDEADEEDGEWLVTNCWKCEKFEQEVTDQQTKERFKHRFRRVFEEIEDEHIAIDPQLIPE